MNSNLSQNYIVAEETHSAGGWNLVLIAAILGPVIGVTLAPSTPARITLALASVLAIGALAMAWSGFQYRFLSDGVEVRTLGFRLRSIPRQSILSYSIEPWTFIRGYGLRGIGRTRAYVWGNKVVHIKTTDGEIFLGHKDPDRIIRDLDRVTGFVTRG